MAVDCTKIRTNLALQTPHYDEGFLPNWQPMDDPFMGRHETEAWPDGTSDTHYFDRIEIGQPDLTAPWQRINAAECENACNPPITHVAFGTTRNSYYPEQNKLYSQLFCLQQMRFQTKVSEQIAEIYKSIRQIPLMFDGDFLRTRAFSRGATVQIAGSAFNTFTPTTGNTGEQLVTINLGSAGNLPTSQLTINYLDYLTTSLELDGYNEESGLPPSMFNLITHPRVWHNLWYSNPEIRNMIKISDVAQANPLFRLGQGISKQPLGNLAPTFDSRQIRFQHMGSGVLNRVLPYENTTATTGTKRLPNPDWINARYALSYLWHPKAIKLWTPAPKKIHDMVPTINSSMMGKWTFVNNQGTLTYTNPDGTTCVKNNDEQFWFYWLAHMEMGFQFKRPELVYPILHLVDGSGKDCAVDDPVCGEAPQYSSQVYTDDPVTCTT